MRSEVGVSVSRPICASEKHAADAIERVGPGTCRIDILVTCRRGHTPIDRSRSSDTPGEDTEKLFGRNFTACCTAARAAAPLSAVSGRRGGEHRHDWPWTALAGIR